MHKHLFYYINIENKVINSKNKTFKQAYTDFYTGEPNDSGDCIQFWMEAGFAWDDANCALQKSFVCKKPEQGKQ